ncbi:MAG: hypothetical protein NT163_05210 [Chlorobiales bacterium]|nr:hypothetical protein [Chlorobiales bacterium]
MSTALLRSPAIDGKQPECRHIEVNGRIKGANTITVTRNEIALCP